MPDLTPKQAAVWQALRDVTGRLGRAARPAEVADGLPLEFYDANSGQIATVLRRLVQLGYASHSVGDSGAYLATR